MKSYIINVNGKLYCVIADSLDQVKEQCKHKSIEQFLIMTTIEIL